MDGCRRIGGSLLIIVDYDSPVKLTKARSKKPPYELQQLLTICGTKFPKIQIKI